MGKYKMITKSMRVPVEFHEYVDSIRKETNHKVYMIILEIMNKHKGAKEYGNDNS